MESSALRQRQQSYICEALSLLKALSSHEIYMQKHRELLCKNQFFDPLTAFKQLDSLKHNCIVGFELKGFFDLFGFQATLLECEDVIQSLNKEEDSLNYDRFIEMVMPYDQVKRNTSLNRYNRIEVDIGTYNLILKVKDVSKKQILDFFAKQVLFNKQFLTIRQQFCAKWGGDIYTLLQKLFKANTSSNEKIVRNPLFDYQQHNINTSSIIQQVSEIGFSDFCEFSRKYKVYFNSEEFKALWRRSKRVQEKLILRVEEIGLSSQELFSIILVQNFNTKAHFAHELSIPASLLSSEEPSYKQNSQRRVIPSYDSTYQPQSFSNNVEGQPYLKQSFSHELQIKYNFAYPECNSLGWQLKQKTRNWNDLCTKMPETYINERYSKAMGSTQSLSQTQYSKYL